MDIYQKEKPPNSNKPLILFITKSYVDIYFNIQIYIRTVTSSKNGMKVTQKYLRLTCHVFNHLSNGLAKKSIHIHKYIYFYIE